MFWPMTGCWFVLAIQSSSASPTLQDVVPMAYALTPLLALYFVMPFRSPTMTSAPVAGLVQPPLPPEPPAEMSRLPEPLELPFQEPTWTR